MLRVELDGPVAWLTLDRPEVRNAINDELIERLIEAFTSLPAHARAVVLRAEGESFCAGGDLQWMRKAAGYSEEQNYQDALRVAALFDAMKHCRAPVVARIQGAAYGGGAGMVAAADIAVASEKATFAFSEVKLGLVAATISPHVIAKIGPGNAAALLTTGEAFEAGRALRIGLVHEVVGPDALDAAVDKKLRSILMAGQEAVALSKHLSWSPSMDAATAARMLARARAGEEGREGVAAFLEKRKASFVAEP